MGVRKVRLSGGDPTSRSDLADILVSLSAIDGLDDLCMTTHGLTLVSHAADFVSAGLGRVNISLDTLDADRFARMTGVRGLERVLLGIDAARSAGLSVKINTVVIRGENDHELVDLVRFAADRDVEIRFIELMPMGPLQAKWAERYVPEQDMRGALASLDANWTPLPRKQDSARRFALDLPDGKRARVGFITPMSCNFCSDCSRLRITSDGAVYPCLMDAPTANILPALRPAFDADRLDEILAAAMTSKQPEHPHDGYGIMTHIGG
jgi:cyclic pyranopterin phosphate synthase